MIDEAYGIATVLGTVRDVDPVVDAVVCAHEGGGLIDAAPHPSAPGLLRRLVAALGEEDR